MTFPLLRKVQGTSKSQTAERKTLNQSCSSKKVSHWQVLLIATGKWVVSGSRPWKQHTFHYLTISPSPITITMVCGLLLIIVKCSYSHSNNKKLPGIANLLYHVMLSTWILLSCALQQVTIPSPTMGWEQRKQWFILEEEIAGMERESWKESNSWLNEDTRQEWGGKKR